MSGEEYRVDLLVEAARMYYENSLTHAEIGKKLGFSRWTASRLIQEARDRGIVRITIEPPQAEHYQIEQALKEYFDLDKVIVVPQETGENATFRAVARAAARHLQSLRPQPRTLAVSWGKTIARVARELPDQWSRGTTVIQTNGGPSYTQDNFVSESIRTIAEKAGGFGRILPAPALVGDSRIASALRSDFSIKATLEAAANADVICFSPGKLEADSVLVRSGYVSEQGLQKLISRGVVGDLLCRFVNAEGLPADLELDKCTIGISLKSLKEARMKVAVASGSGKTATTMATLRGGYVDTLIVDSGLAHSLLESAEIPIEN